LRSPRNNPRGFVVDMFETNNITYYVKKNILDGTERRLLYEQVAFVTGSLKCQRLML